MTLVYVVLSMQNQRKLTKSFVFLNISILPVAIAISMVNRYINLVLIWGVNYINIVMSIPDSGTTAALGYARASGIPFAEGLVKNRYSGRTFIKPNQEERELAVRMKLNALPHIVGGKRIVLIDDSIVRGTTSGIIVKMLKEAGAKEVYMCVSSPTIEYSCHYGIDTSVRKELIAATHTVDEIKDYIHADKLHYLSREGLCRAVSDIAPNDLCFACFNGDYSVEVPAEQEEGVKYVLE